MSMDQGRGGAEQPDEAAGSGGTEQPPQDAPPPQQQPPQDAPRPQVPPQQSAPPPPPYGAYGQHPQHPQYPQYPQYGPGPYPPPGPGPFAWGPPPAPKPGVIPLRPLQLGDVLGGTFATVGRCWRALFGISLIAYGGALIAVVLALGLAYVFVGDHFRAFIDTPEYGEPLWSDTLPVIVAGISVWVFALIAMLVASAMVSAVCPAALQDAVLGRPSAFGTVWRRTMARVPAVIGTGLLTALIVAIPFLLFLGVGLVVTVFSYTEQSNPGPVLALWFLGLIALLPLVMWLWVRFSLAPAVAVFESAGPVTALRRSTRLVRGSWWRIFGISLLVSLMAGVAGYFIQIPFNMIGMFSAIPTAGAMGPDPEPAEVFATMGVFMFFIMIGALVSQLVTALFPQLAVSLLYVDQRIRKESLDVTLAQAAGVPLTPAPAAAPAPAPYPG
ncbi:hypothetical protein RCO28_04280 [Streptomyces sp. LHD-70]|uniref:hypothetical protein n=1 Tax=Streptomyces sp. LHD-70 TaxID=3072140 RepID=UPI00280C55E5|nr:hypothetical protein [Streptomyces sp. LHD-70]MDQ8701712.1 hypothetical protein [Streptomyces sp. LHD-70]